MLLLFLYNVIAINIENLKKIASKNYVDNAVARILTNNGQLNNTIIELFNLLAINQSLSDEMRNSINELLNETLAELAKEADAVTRKEFKEFKDIVDNDRENINLNSNNISIIKGQMNSAVDDIKLANDKITELEKPKKKIFYIDDFEWNNSQQQFECKAPPSSMDLLLIYLTIKGEEFVLIGHCGDPQNLEGMTFNINDELKIWIAENGERLMFDLHYVVIF